MTRQPGRIAKPVRAEAKYKPWGNSKSAQEAFDLPRVRLYELMNAGLIKSAKVGRQRLFDFRSIEHFLEGGGTHAA